MGVVQLPDHIRAIIDSQVSAGRVASEAAFLEDAVLRYAEDLEAEDPIIAAAEVGIADIEAGRYTLIAGSEDMARLRADFSNRLDELVPARIAISLGCKIRLFLNCSHGYDKVSLSTYCSLNHPG